MECKTIHILLQECKLDDSLHLEMVPSIGEAMTPLMSEPPRTCLCDHSMNLPCVHKSCWKVDLPFFGYGYHK